MELELKNITHTYPNGKMALQQVSLCLEQGIYGLLGPNGAGKSTLMKIITDNLAPTEGKVLFEGKNIRTSSRAFRSQLGYMPQQQGMYSQFTGRRFLWYMASLKGLSRQDAKKRIGELLEAVNLTDVADRRIGSYSGGMKQRLLIAQAILNAPKILVLDEPTAGLDPKERIRIRNFVSDLSQDRIVLFATHVVSDVECIARELILMKDGEIIRQGTPAQLIEEMQGLVWEFLAPPERMEEIQKRYLVSNLSVTPRGILVRAVGREEELPRRKRPAQAGTEEVYLYHMESSAGTADRQVGTS